MESMETKEFNALKLFSETGIGLHSIQITNAWTWKTSTKFSITNFLGNVLSASEKMKL